MEIIRPVASQAMETKAGAVMDAPHTEFPYPEVNEEDALRYPRLESDATLCEDAPEKIENLVPEDVKVFSAPARPDLVARRFMTEAPAAVAQELRPLAPLTLRRSTGAQPTKTRSYRPSSRPSSASSNSSSFDEDTSTRHHWRRNRPKSEHDPLSTSRLNQVRRKPSRTHSKFSDEGRFSVGNEHFHSRGKVARDGRLDISVNETANSGYLAKALGSTIERHLRPHPADKARVVENMKDDTELKHIGRVPRLNIVIMVIGSRGDIQPFLKIGRILQDKYKHRVRIATHPTFKKFVEQDIGLEFFSVGGDPSELMSFMVKNPGLVPSLETIKAGEIGRRRDSMFEMFQGFWRACINATDDESDVANLKMMGSRAPFIADAIIANPPSFAHLHCAERLGIPLHLVFTFPYTPTSAFPHPLANIKATNVDKEYTNFMSYPLVDLMTWQGLGDLVNRFRVKTLGLEPVSTLWAPSQVSRLKVPTTYLWSPGLIPKPKDWGPEIDIAGYVFLDLASSFKPDEQLASFLERKDARKLIYIGFGSISGIEDPRAFTQLIFDAVEKADVRALVSKGWGGMGDGMDVPDSIHLLDNIPHDWLFPQVDAVVHHGGAGTTAIGLKCGKPTMIVPFFGDQPFWSAMIAKAGAGAKESLPLKKLTVSKFAEGIKQCLAPEAKEKADEIAKCIEAEGDGAENAVDSFHRSLPLSGPYSMRCEIFEDRLAVWQVKNSKLHLSALAADLLVENKQLKWGDLRLLRNVEWHDFQGPGEPLTGVGGAAIASLQEAIHGISSIDNHIKRDLKKHDLAKRRRERRTVADAVAISGQVAHAARGRTTIESERSRPAGENVELSFQGEAEPPKFFEGEIRPTVSRHATDGLTPAPVTVLRDVGHGLGHSTKAVITMPLDIWMALTLGFRNAPRLYGDATVRPPPTSITGIRSGLKAAGHELWLGFYDGFTGLVRIPYHDIKTDGMTGLPKGVARGFGGMILKPISGILGLGAYSGKGVEVGIRKRFRDTKKTDRWIRRARMTQGVKDVLAYHEKVGGGSTVATTACKNEELDRARTKALTHWSSHERARDEIEQKERRFSFVPTRNKKGPDRAATGPAGRVK